MAAAKPATGSFDATLSKSSKRFGIFNEPEGEEVDGTPKGIVYCPKPLWEQLGKPDAVTVTITAK